MQLRFFKAPYIDHHTTGKSTWQKVCVLSEDGTLYCEHLDYMNPVIFKQGDFNFDTFTGAEFKFHGYQSLEEITREEAINMELIKQKNWVQRYIDENGLDNSIWL